MSVLVPGEAAWEHVWAIADAMAEDWPCFLCGATLTRHELAVYWGGAGGQIVLHKGCAPSFIMRLARDCWELERHEQVGP